MYNGLLINKQGDKLWYKDNLLHREDGPAIEYRNGDKNWMQNGLFHRLDGPALEFADGEKCWYYEDEWLEKISSQEEFERWLKLRIFS